jgi:hypothetical protein
MADAIREYVWRGQCRRVVYGKIIDGVDRDGRVEDAQNVMCVEGVVAPSGASAGKKGV